MRRIAVQHTKEKLLNQNMFPGRELYIIFFSLTKNKWFLKDMYSIIIWSVSLRFSNTILVTTLNRLTLQLMPGKLYQGTD